MNPDPALVAAVLGRTESFLADDYSNHRGEIEAAIAGARVLVVGGAGSIGAMVTELLVEFRPDALHVVDIDENGLAELVRDFRSRGVPVGDFRTLPVDFGSPIMERLLRDSARYDVVMNFAAIKHVRSEKDLYSLLHMIDTNVVKQTRFIEWLARYGHARRYFAVSTDKAANPVSLMGASKRLMEDVVFGGPMAITTSARFANVAFSNGSLLQSFLLRLAKRQPVAAPQDTRRYFISVREAGELCLLAATATPARHLSVPRFHPERDLRPLDLIAAQTLRHYGFAPAFYEDEARARADLPAELARGRYPLVLTPLDTSGEKPYEEFWGEGESPVELGFKQLLGIRHAGGDHAAAVERLAALIAEPAPPTTKTDIVNTIAGVVRGFRHRETGRSLDDRA